MMKRTKNKYHYEYKKCSKAEDKIKRNKLLDSCLNGGGDLFKEIKTMRKCKPVVATSMDGVQTNRCLMYNEKQRLYPYNSNYGLNNSNLNSKQRLSR